jgi:mannose-1-phosphate guanylyltransferase
VEVSNIVVVDSGDALLICSRDRVQDVKLVVEELRKRGRNDLL